MNLLASIRNLNRFEKSLWALSAAGVTLCFVLGGAKDILTLIGSLIGSLIGVTALIFVAKGDVIGQVLTIVFAVFYGVVSYAQRYYGEIITYLCMTAPIALASVVTWLRHPYAEREVAVAHLGQRKALLLALATVAVTVAFYFILGALGNNSLLFSTLSVTTSFLASALTMLRSEYYALAYASNDVVLIVLWVIASVADASCVPMIICFAMFLLNDLYGFFNWRRMRRRQTAARQITP